MTTLIWAVALVAAVLWPGRIIGPLDGAPLDRPLEALLLGLALPVLWILHPAFLRTRTAKATILGLLVWKLATFAALPQGGWCGEFATPYPPPASYRLDRSWDLRSWSFHDAPVDCSAIVARPYDRLSAFPAWSINIPIDAVFSLKAGPAPVSLEPPRPPDGTFLMMIAGQLHPDRPGTLAFEIGSGMELDGTLDTAPLPPARDHRVTVPVAAGEHAIALSLTLTGDRWRFVPLWNERNLFSEVPTTLRAAGRLTRSIQSFGSYVAPMLILVLLGGWAVSAVRELRPNAAVLGWTAASALLAFGLGGRGQDTVARVAVVVLLAAVFVPVDDRLRNLRGAMLLFGVPWLGLFAARSVPQVGHFTLFSVGDDWLTFQRFAYRIFMRGYWLQGGEPTFWYQPLYRWTTGVLHLMFGDSSVGDLYWDAFGALIGALFAFEIARRVAGFRLAVLTGTAVLVTLTIGPNWYVIGRGLSEFSSSAWLFLAALALRRARAAPLGHAFIAGLFAILAFYTRLNHLPVTIALLAFTLPDSVAAASLMHPRLLWERLPKAVAATYLATLTAGVCAFALRTWYYTGSFSLFAGTTRVFNGTGLGLTLESFWSVPTWRSAVESVMMIVTVQDPPRFDPRSWLVVGGVVCSVGALLQAPVLRRLPLHITSVCVASIAGGLVARGLAYPGRFSIHLIPIAVAVCLLALARLLSQQRDRPDAASIGEPELHRSREAAGGAGRLVAPSTALSRAAGFATRHRE